MYIYDSHHIWLIVFSACNWISPESLTNRWASERASDWVFIKSLHVSSSSSREREREQRSGAWIGKREREREKRRKKSRKRNARVVVIFLTDRDECEGDDVYVHPPVAPARAARLLPPPIIAIMRRYWSVSFWRFPLSLLLLFHQHA